jgi:hypothetical protein
MEAPKGELSWQNGRDEPPPFGTEMRKEFGQNWDLATFCNQGSYGLIPKMVIEYK